MNEMSPTKPHLKPKDAPDLGRFAWEDPLRLNDQLTEDERMLRDAARAFAQDKLQPRVIEAFEDETVDPAIFREMGEMGLLGATIPEEYGGLGAGYVTYGLVAREIERVDLRLPLDDVGAVQPGDVPDLRLRLGGAAPEIPAQARHAASGSAVSA